MTRVMAGLDVGGTKTHLRVTESSNPGTVLLDAVVPSAGWSAVPAEAAASWLAQHLRDVPGSLAALAVGAQGCETPEHCLVVRHELQKHLNVPITVVNDGELLLPAAGFSSGIAVVVGTGSIALHDDGYGKVTRAGGWGWVLGDDGSASALVREAAKAVLAQADRGQPLSPLGRALLASVGVSNVADLAQALSWGTAPETWGTHAPAVVNASSPDAHTVLADGARAIVALVETLAHRGLLVTDIVFAGGLVTAVPSYWKAIQRNLTASFPAARPHLLAEPPVTGAINLAARLL